MATEFNGQTMDAVMTLKMVDGTLTGIWESQGMEMELEDLTIDGNKISFSRSVGEQSLDFKGTIDGNAITGKYTGAFGELNCTGKRESR